jgi:hypothetical protein
MDGVQSMISGIECRTLGTAMNSLRHTNSVFNRVGLNLLLDVGVELLLSQAGCYGMAAPLALRRRKRWPILTHGPKTLIPSKN